MLKILPIHSILNQKFIAENFSCRLLRQHKFVAAAFKDKICQNICRLETMYFSRITVGKKETVVENSDNNLFDKDLQDITA